ncbi:MAG: [protein-PII] uridylyltransferase [Verrucomicrobiales bacterium]|jgi:[protein-PII] uridylyltransferase
MTSKSQKEALRKPDTHARSRLSKATRQALSNFERIQLYKRFLHIEHARIRMLHRSGESGLRIARKLSDLADRIVRCVYEDALESAREEFGDQVKDEFPLTVVATGGYGRRRLNPASDLDLCFIHRRASTPALQPWAMQMVADIPRDLSDLGYKVLPATRNIRETIRQSNEDDITRTSFIEARLLHGEEKLFEELAVKFERQCIHGKEDDFLEFRLNDQRRRHAKYDFTAYLQEPQVKEGCGGLRDYQNLIWLTFAKLRTTTMKDLVSHGLISETGYRELRRGYSFLMRVRNELHYEQGRSTDILTLRLQGIVATSFNYPQRGILRKTEAFMKDYYEHTQHILSRYSELMDHFYIEDKEARTTGGLKNFLARRKTKKETFGNFYSKTRRLYTSDPKIFKENPHEIMLMFQHAQQRHLRLSPELYRLVQANFGVINRQFCYSKANRETFEAILCRVGSVAESLRQMHRVGFLGRYINEFGALTNLVQHEFFHRYPADEHTLRTIDWLDKLASSEERGHQLYKKLFHEIDDPFLLYLSLILHDTGRAANTDHHDEASTVLAMKVCNRLVIKGKRRKLILFLVDNHLQLYRTATSRNIDDPKTIEEFAKVVRNQEELDYLMVMSFADSNGTSPDSWTSWKESLIRQLYNSASEYYKDAEGFAEKQRPELGELAIEVATILGEDMIKPIVAHLDCLPTRYFAFRSKHAVAADITQILSFKKAAGATVEGQTPPPIVRWKAKPDQGCSKFSVVYYNRPGLLAKIAGCLAANKINILSADIFVRPSKRGSFVIDTFRVCTTDFAPIESERVMQSVEKLLTRAVAGEAIDFDQLINHAPRSILDKPDDGKNLHHVPQRVFLNNDASPDHTIAEIQAADRLALLFDIFSNITDLGLQITNSRISTTLGAAIDSLYIVDQMDRKITDPEMIEKLYTAIEKAMHIET